MVSNVYLKFLLVKVVVKEVNLVSFFLLFSNRKFSGVIVEDCLTVLLNLLKTNASNQSYFRESSFIRRLVNFFELNSIGEKRWVTQKVANVHLLLQVNMTNLFLRNNCFLYRSRSFGHLFHRQMHIKILWHVNVPLVNVVRN
jgi:hypothetical protein